MTVLRYTLVLLLFLQSIAGNTAEVESGRIDLTNHNFNSKEVYELNGEWQFDLNKFVNPFTAHEIQTFHTVPKLWDKSAGYGTYAITIILPPDRPLLGLAIPDIYSSYQLTINGQYSIIKGYASDNKEEAIPFRLKKIAPIPEEYDSIHVVLHVSNYRHNKGGIAKPIKIGDLIYLEHRQLLARTFDTFITGCLMVGFFFFLGLYVYGRHDKTSLYFALFSLSYAIRVCFSENHMINLMIPSFPWDLQIRVEYGSMYLSTIFFGYFVYHLFPKALPRFFIQAYTVIALVFIPLTIFATPYFFTKVNFIHLVSIFIGMGLVTFSFLKAVFKGQEGSVYSLLSIVGFLVVLSSKTFDYFNLIDEILLVTFSGQILFFLSHALVLSNHYSSSWRLAKENAEKSEQAKTDFLSVMSHEIRTPLNSVIGTTHHLIDSNPRADQGQDLKNLKVSSQNLLHIVNNILDFNKLDSGTLKLEATNVNLKEFCQHLTDQVKNFANEKGLELKVDICEKIPVVQVDETRLVQILTNLLNNAIKFTDSGSVELRVSFIEHQGGYNLIEFNVIDSGIGITPSNINLIFEPFQQVSSSNSRKYTGTGLGLTITKKLLEIMGSSLEIESRPGLGSRFSFRLKLKSGKVIAKPETSEEKDLKKVRILLVDDHDLNVMMTKNFLVKWNADVTIANDGNEAVKQAVDQPFDLILMDIQMPGMDGFEASERIRNHGYENAIIAVTADSYQENETFLRSGIDARLSKPFDPEALYQTIKTHTVDNGVRH